jgi:hypothetical protein
MVSWLGASGARVLMKVLRAEAIGLAISVVGFRVARGVLVNIEGLRFFYEDLKLI